MSDGQTKQGACPTCGWRQPAERIAELERQLIDDDNYDSLTARIAELSAENERLRKAIKDAPHHWDCNIPMAARKDGESVMAVVMSEQCVIECTCWKREALGDE